MFTGYMLISVISKVKINPTDDNQTMICAGMEHGGDELCKWDFGGPMVCLTDGRFYLQGVVISRKGCAQPKRFGVYSKVKQFLRWIDEETD